MLTKRHKIIKGTIYLQGHQSSFHNSITQALNVRPSEDQLTYEISTDLIRTMRNKALVFRVDYLLALDVLQGVGKRLLTDEHR